MDPTPSSMSPTNSNLSPTSNKSTAQGLDSAEGFPFPKVEGTQSNAENGSASQRRGDWGNSSPASRLAEIVRSGSAPDHVQRVETANGDATRTPVLKVSKSPISRKAVPPSALNGSVGITSQDQGAIEALPHIRDGTSTPPDRKSVQFARELVDHEPSDGNSRLRPPFLGVESGNDGQGKGKNPSFYSKLKALATSPSFTHSRSASDGNNIMEDDGSTPRSQRTGNSFPMTLEEDGSEDDADVEESGAEDVPNLSSRKKRKAQRRGVAESAPSSPRSPFRPNFLTSQSVAPSPDTLYRPVFAPRRATTDSLSGHGREGLSEDEGRARMKSDRPWRKSGWTRGFTSAGDKSDDQAGAEDRRPNQIRRLTGFGNQAGDSSGPSAWRRHRAERGTSVSAQKWRQIKAQLKLMGQRQKKERTIDHEKSAELLAELMAGSPAALMFASMFQRDPKGHKRIPVLLEQIKARVTDSEVDKHDPSDSGDRPTIFRIELEYGNGVQRMNWVVMRSIQDFAQMHAAYKAHFAKERLKLRSTAGERLPKFPLSAFPYMRSWQGFGDEKEDEEEEATGNGTDEGGNERPSVKKRQRSSFVMPRRRSTAGNGAANGTMTASALAGMGNVGLAVGSASAKREAYPERQRRMLEAYLQKMIQFFLFRPESNRLCKFLELSALGMRLAAEGGYHGKEGQLIIQSGKGVDFRKTLTPTNIVNRHSPKWFLVRHSYVVCVDSPEEMHIYDVFLFDSDFSIQSKRPKLAHQSAKQLAKTATQAATKPQHHRLKLRNSERTLKLIAKSEKMVHQFEESINKVIDESQWTKENRFDSFAPVRTKCFAQWLVDGRDHMWVVSRAINQAKDVIYIHDWWLSPELYMRRPPAISHKWRLDRLLKRKAEEGVKIFVIMYRNIESAVPIDSGYTKFSLLDLHPNIFVQRSPNQIRQNTFFWAHHEKLCLIDHTVAFVGGIDLCFGRWDTPQHTVVDDKATGFEDVNTPKDADHCQLWPGKDYSNPRIQDFFALNKPYEEMYDREEIPRMPWHDISMQVVGQPARDLTRHFVQRWNYILRQRKPTRPTPFLLPPPDFDPADLESLGLDGTCEVQILRSCGPWSIGTTERVEHSIMTAYCKMIEQSEHFVYIENQFFITSCSTDATRIQNTVGDALVERIVRAYKNDETWRAVIVIPLIPGFQNTVAEPGGTSVRLIMQYQYRSICRGESSIFGRLRAQGIDPEEYIQFYSLRSWGKIGSKKMLVTEQLYIHAKCMIVDDRVAIIGSANINERSMLGSRDSECAAIVRDTDMIWSRMNGKKYLVGRFPHTLRMRLMREHLGLDVDKIMEETPLPKEPSPVNSPREDEDELESDMDGTGAAMGRSKSALKDGILERAEKIPTFNHDVDWEQAENPNLKSNRKLTEDHRVTGNPEHRKDVIGEGADQMVKLEAAGFGIGRDSVVLDRGKEVLVSDLAPEGKGTLVNPKKRGQSTDELVAKVGEREKDIPLPPRPQLPHLTTEQLGLPMLSQLPALPEMDDSDIGGPNVLGTGMTPDFSHPLLAELHRPLVDDTCMKDPIIDSFFLDTWQVIAENNTKIYRSVFRCMPDNEVRDWKAFHEYESYDARFKEMQGASGDWKPKNREQMAHAAKAKENTTSGPPGTGLAASSNAISAGAAQLPYTAQAKAGDLKNKLMSVVSDSHPEYLADEKDKLRQWAAEANRAQFERQDKEKKLLQKQDTRSSQDEKQALRIPDTVPESAEGKQSRDGSDNPTNTSSGTLDEADPQAINSEKRAGTEPYVGYSEALNMNHQARTGPRRRRATTKSSRAGGGEFNASHDIPTSQEAEELLELVQGHLIVWPYDWLDKVEAGGNWLFAKDNLTPLEIYI